MKKILIVSNEFPPMVGGAGIYLSNLLNSLDFTCVHVTLVVPESSVIANRDNLEVIFISQFRRLSLFNYYFALNALNLADYSKIIINDPSSSLIFSFFFRNVRHKQIVFLHGLEPEQILSSPRLLYKILGFKSKYLNYLRDVNKVVFVSRDLETKFNESSKTLPLANRYCLSPYIESSDFLSSNYVSSLTNKDIVKKLKENKVILSVSRIEEKKGYFRLLNAIQPILESNGDTIWVIVGTGSYLDKLKKLVKEREIDNSVLILNTIPRQYLSFYYANSDVFVLLSEYRESFVFVYLEALSFGAKVIGNKFGGVSEILSDDGELVSLEDTVGTITNKIYSQLQLVNTNERVFKEVDKYSKEIFIRRLSEVL